MPNDRILQGATNTPSTLGMCRGCVEVKKELQEFKEQFERNVLLYQLYAAKATDSLTASLPNPTPTPMPRNDAVVPECPVAIRPLPTCSMPSPFLQWNPWLLQTPLSAQNKAMTPTLFQVPHVDSSKQWNSPNSVDSSQKSDCSSSDATHIDPVGMEIGESSPVSSTSEKRISATSPEVPPVIFVPKAEPISTSNPLILRQQIEQRCVNSDISKDRTEQLLNTAQHPNSLFTTHSEREDDHNSIGDPNIKGRPVIPRRVDGGSIGCNQISQMQIVQHLLNKKQNMPPIPNRPQQTFSPVITERKKTVPDDCLKLIRRKGISKRIIENIKIPVPQATKCDPGFTAASEEEIIQQFLQNRRCDDDVCKAMTFLSKMLAEKRVFGTKLMAETTVAGPNHSTYKNLPEEGIHYIAYVCRQVMRNRIQDEEQFWDVFRDVTRKLAARCRRVRHSRKNRCENSDLARLRNCSKEHMESENHSPNSMESVTPAN